jgi:hypothetical protein
MSKDTYGFDLERGFYKLRQPGETEHRIVNLFKNEFGVWTVERTEEPIGSPVRFTPLSCVHPHSCWIKLNYDLVPAEPGKGGYEKPSLLDQLGKLEQIAHAARAELRRVELLTCQAMGVAINDGTEAAEAAFDLAWNMATAETVYTSYTKHLERLGANA